MNVNAVITPGEELLAVAALLFLSITIQSFTLTALRRRQERLEPWLRVHSGFWHELVMMYAIIMIVVLMHVAQALVWAVFYRYVVGMDSMRDAFYHSMLSLTTMDTSAGVLPDGWRLLGAAEGLTGWIVFSWSTGWVFMFLSSLHALRREAKARQTAPAGAQSAQAAKAG
jgi:hypothetical protein